MFSDMLVLLNEVVVLKMTPCFYLSYFFSNSFKSVWAETENKGWEYRFCKPNFHYQKKNRSDQRNLTLMENQCLVRIAKWAIDVPTSKALYLGHPQ